MAEFEGEILILSGEHRLREASVLVEESRPTEVVAKRVSVPL